MKNIFIIFLFFLFTTPCHASMYDQVNYQRKLYKLPPLTQNVILERVAMLKACDMNTRGYFSHQDPEGRYSWHLFDEQGYIYHTAGENLIWGYSNDSQRIYALMHSYKHRINILDKTFKDIGIARCGKYIAQEFGS